MKTLYDRQLQNLLNQLETLTYSELTLRHELEYRIRQLLKFYKGQV